jgi:hypothetical protein
MSVLGVNQHHLVVVVRRASARSHSLLMSRKGVLHCNPLADLMRSGGERSFRPTRHLVLRLWGGSRWLIVFAELHNCSGDMLHTYLLFKVASGSHGQAHAVGRRDAGVTQAQSCVTTRYPKLLILLVPAEGIEPPTFGLQNRCSTAELSRQIKGLGDPAA